MLTPPCTPLPREVVGNDAKVRGDDARNDNEDDEKTADCEEEGEGEGGEQTRNAASKRSCEDKHHDDGPPRKRVATSEVEEVEEVEH